MGSVRLDGAIGDGASGGGTVYVRPTSASFVLGANNTYTRGTIIENSCLTVDTGGTLSVSMPYLCLVPFTHVCVRLAKIDRFSGIDSGRHASTVARA